MIVAALLAAFAVQSGIAAIRDSVTVDELAHLPIGLYFLRHGDFSPDPINPPLSRMLPALALIAGEARLDPPSGADEWQMGLRFMRDNVGDYHELYVRARAVVILLGLLLGVLVYRWSLELHGHLAGLVALTLYAFSPMMLTHGHLVTVDMAGALGFAFGVYQVARYRRNPGLLPAASLGAVVGLGLLLKLSCLPLVAFAAGALLLDSVAVPTRFLSRVGRAALAAAITLALLNVGYGFQAFAQPLGQIDFVDGGRMADLAANLPALRLPVPSALLRGLDLIASAELKGDRSFYLAGQISDRGWWHYHFIAYALKTPLPLLIVIALAASRLVRRQASAGEGLLWMGAAVVFLAGGVLNPLKLGVRHVIAAEVFFCVLAAGSLAPAIATVLQGSKRAPDVIRAALAAIVLVWQAGSSAAQAPQYISYFNELGGGRARGHEWLADSNLDWGQDLIRLREFLAGRGPEPIELAYFGTVHPGAYGIAFEPLRSSDSDRLKVVSASLLVGLPFRIWRATDSWGRADEEALRSLSRRQPSGRIGTLFFFSPRAAPEARITPNGPLSPGDAPYEQGTPSPTSLPTSES